MLDVAAVARVLGLAADVCTIEGLPLERWSAGNAFAYVPVRRLEALRRCRIDLARFNAAVGDDGHAAAFVFCRETIDAANAFHARMFAPDAGVLEDPATGSAAAAFAGYLTVHGGYANGDRLIRIEQGHEMGRPSLMALQIRIAGGRLTAASIGGDAVVVSEGTIEV